MCLCIYFSIKKIAIKHSFIIVLKMLRGNRTISQRNHHILGIWSTAAAIVDAIAALLISSCKTFQWFRSKRTQIHMTLKQEKVILLGWRKWNTFTANEWSSEPNEDETLSMAQQQKVNRHNRTNQPLEMRNEDWRPCELWWQPPPKPNALARVTSTMTID